MKTKIMLVAMVTLLIGSLCFWACQKDLPLEMEPVSETQIIPDQYIVIFKDNVADVKSLAHELAELHGAEIRYIYESAIKGFSGTLSARAVEALQKHPQVALVEADVMVPFYVALKDELEVDYWPASWIKTDGPTSPQVNPPWGLDRIDQRGPIRDGMYRYDQTGEGVRVYLIGYGITPHDDFEGRLIEGWSPDGNFHDTSSNGSNTAMASIIGGTTYGVAKNVTLVSVRAIVNPVQANLVNAIEWVIEDYKEKGGPAVAHAGFFSQSTDALDAAIDALVATGITFVSGGVTGDLDACDCTPSGIDGVITVSAVNRLHNMDALWASLKVDCIDIFAPGTGIPNVIVPMRGPGIAAAHVTGLAAQYLEVYQDKKGGEVLEYLIEKATKGLVNGAINEDGDGYNNYMLYSRGMAELTEATFEFECHGLECTFSDTSDGNTTAWDWDFGDGSAVVTGKVGPTHQFAGPGIYNVTLTVSDGTTSKTITKPVTVPFFIAPTIERFDVTMLPQSGPWRTVRINWTVTDVNYDLSNVLVQTFANGKELARASQNVSGYLVEGQHELRSRTQADQVRITVTNGSGISTVKTYPDPLIVNDPPVAAFDYSVSGLTVTFTDNSYDPDGSIVNRFWDFGDGYYFQGLNPIHTYDEAGDYSVTLTVTDNYLASGSETKEVEVVSNGNGGEPVLYIITGTVTDFDYNSALPGATVSIDGTNYSATTGIDGSFEIPNVNEGNYYITASLAGYISETKNIAVFEDTTVNFVLEKDDDPDEPGDPDPEPGDLSIDFFDLTNTSNPQFARLVVDWEVSGVDLSVVTLSISGPNGDSVTWNVSGNTASGQHEFSFRRGHGDYTVTLTVTDSSGTLTEPKNITL